MMQLLTFLTAMLAVIVPTPAPSATPHELKTIVIVVSSPYCNSLADNFNGTMSQLLANDRVLDGVNVQLGNLVTVFHETNYTQRFLAIRDAVGRQQNALNDSLAAMHAHLNALRDGARLTTDPQAAAQATKAANDLATAYDHQRQLAIDLQSVYRGLLEFDITDANPALGGFDPVEEREPEAMLDVRSYLRLTGQRAIVARSEDEAVDVAYAAAQSYCTKK